MSQSPSDDEEEQQIEIAGLRVVAVGDRAVARSIVILLHGFAMTPSDLSPFAHSLGLSAWFLFPEGPLEAGVVADRIDGRAWWHIDPVLREQALAKGPRDFAEQHPPDLPAARARLEAFLDQLILREAGDENKPLRPIILCGFSQGGMLACDFLLRTTSREPKASGTSPLSGEQREPETSREPKASGTSPLSGEQREPETSPRIRQAIKAVALLSASRIAFDEWAPFLDPKTCNLHGMPILVSHGSQDADLAFGAGVALKDCLIAAGANVTWVPFDQGHEIPLVVWRHLRKLIEKSVT